MLRRNCLALLFSLLVGLAATARAADPGLVLVEAEGFKDRGGWMLDTQFVHIMGSPYLLAHGMEMADGSAPDKAHMGMSNMT